MGLTAAASGSILLLLLSGSVLLPHATEDQCGPVTSVRDPNLQINVKRGGSLISSWSELRCVSKCCLPRQPSYIWYKNGDRVEEESAVYRDIFEDVDSVYCAVKRLENFPSPQICVRMKTCNSLTYTEQKMIAISGSSVDISCTYSGPGYDGLKFWFSPERSHLWRNLSTPEDLSEDPQYTGRVESSERKGHLTLTINNLRVTDSAQYRFQFGGRFNTLPGTTLIVIALEVQVISVTANQSVTEAELRCQSSCLPEGPLSYVWFKNGQKQGAENNLTYTDQFQPGDNVSCAVTGYEDYRSPSIDPCRVPSVSVSPSGRIVEGSSVTLNCSSDVEAAADYTWYKEGGDSPVASGQIFTITHVRLEHSGNYYCEVQDGKGRYKSILHLSVVTIPALEVQVISVTANQSVTEAELRCQSSCLPEGPLSYVWFKNGQKQGAENNLTYTDQFQPGDNVSCAITGYEDYRSPSTDPCRVPSVSVSPSSRIVEGSSVTLNCSSDVEAAADYIWYKEGGDSPVASGQIFTITHVRLEHSGNYYCEVQDGKGRYKSILHLSVVTKNLTVLIMNIVRLTLLILLLLSVLLVNLWTRKKKEKTQRFNTEPTEFFEMRDR